MRFFEFYKKINELAPAQPTAPAVAPNTQAQAQPQAQGTSPPVPPVDPNFTQAINSLGAAVKTNPNLKAPYDAFVKQLQAAGISMPGMQPAAPPKPSMTSPQQPQAHA